MHYENANGDFVLPSELIEVANVFDEENEGNNFSLPWRNVNENQIYDKGKWF